MSEREPRGESSEPRGEAWSTVLEPALGTSPEEAHDVAFGRGQRFAVGDKCLEVYPDALVARLTAPDARLELFRLSPPTISSRGMVFETQARDARLSLTPQGEVTLFLASATPVEQTPEEAPPSIRTQEPTPSREERERVTLVGRVGAVPAFRTTPKGILIARFPLAVRESENKTTWHTVLAFGARAAKLQESVKKGDAVEVIGYKHLREAKTREGKGKTVEEVYAVVVKNR